jgi:hypothetical protein
VPNWVDGRIPADGPEGRKGGALLMFPILMGRARSSRRDVGTRKRGNGGHRGYRLSPNAEVLGPRRLLSGYNGPAVIQPVVSPTGIYLIEVAGPGYVSTEPAARGAVNIRAYGTTSGTTITVVQARPRLHVPNGLLSIHNLTVRSGELGNVDATAAALTGRVTPLAGGVTTFDVGAIEPKAQVDIQGDVGSLSAGTIDIGPTGRFTISGDLNSLGQSDSESGGLVPLEPAGAMTIGSITIDGGILSIGRDSLASITIQDNLDLNHDGVLAIGRDQDGNFSVNGSIILDTGGQLTVGRNLNDLAVNGNVIVNPSGSGIVVHGALNGLTINGYFQGQGGLSAPSLVDLGVGLNLSNLTISGGVSGKGGLINANITAGGTVSAVGVVYGTYNSSVVSNTTMVS